MADRTVSVKLKADVDAYNRGIIEAKTTTEGLERQVKVLERDVKELTPETVKASKSVETLGVEAGKAKTQAKGLGDEVGKTKDKTTGLGEETTKTKARIVSLAEEITKTKTALAALGDEFRKTGSVDMDKFKSLSTTLRDLERVRDGVSRGVQDGIKDGADRGLKDFGSIAGSNPYIAAGITGAIVAASPFIGAALNAALLLGVGGGGLVAGIVAAAQDSRVKSAWTQTINDIKSEFTAAAGPLVGPLVNAAQKVGDAFGSMLPGIRQGLAQLGPVVDRLVSGVIRMVQAAAPGFGRAFEASLPLLKQLGDELPSVGSALSSFFDSMSRGSRGASQGLHDMVTVINTTIIATGWLVEHLSKAWDFVRNNPIGKLLGGLVPGGQLLQGLDVLGKIGDKGKKAGEDVKAGVGAAGEGAAGAAPKIDSAAGATQRLAGSFSDAIREAGFFTGTIDKVNGGNISLATAQIGAERAVRDFKTALEESHGSLDITTEKGAAAREAAIRLAQAAGEVAQKTYEQSGSSSQGATALEGYRTALYNTARQSGLTEAAAHALVDQYLKVPPEVSTTVKAPGLAQTKSDAAEAYRGLDRLNGKVVNTYAYNHIVTYYEDGRTQAGNSRYGRNDFATGGLRKAAVGMFIPASDPGTVLTGEPQTGGEWLIPARGIDTGRAEMLGKAAMSNYGLDVVPRQAPGYAQFANTRPMPAGGGGGSSAGPSAEAIADALAARLVPALSTIAAIADRPIDVNVDSQRIAQAVRQGNRGLGRRG